MTPALAALLIQESPLLLHFVMSLFALKKAHPQLTQQQVIDLTTFAHTMDDGTRALIFADQASHPGA